MSDDLTDAWDRVKAYFEGVRSTRPVDGYLALLSSLRPAWERLVRPDTSILTLRFTAPGTTGWRAAERVEVAFEADRVRMALVREIPRRSLTEPGGRVVVAGDFTRPENAVPAVEALLHQLT